MSFHEAHQAVGGARNAIGENRCDAVFNLGANDVWQRLQGFQRQCAIGVKVKRSFMEMLVNEFLRCAERNNFAVINNSDTITEPFGFFHVVRRHEHRLATLLEIRYHIPHRTPRLRIKPGCWFVQKDNLRIVDQRNRDRQTLALPT